MKQPHTRFASARRLGAVLLLLGALALPGCAGPVLRAKVIEADVSFVLIVPRDDPRLEDPGIANVTVAITSDPNSLGRQTIGTAVTDGFGEMSMNIELPLAGLARYEIGVVARKQGYTQTTGDFLLPADNQVVLIFMRSGRDTHRSEEDLRDTADQYR
ncbi:MAG: hypothetical protein KAS72_09520 [Phycisphaerales bacterium]|nr:hypothetical protein [Phycisphaerales bacterium]